MNINIDFEKSIRRKRLIYLGTRKQRFILSVRHRASGIFALLVSLSLIAFVYYNDAEPILVGLVSLPALLVLISIYLQGKLASAKSDRSHEDQTAIIRFLLRKYPGIIRHNCSDEVIIISNPQRSMFNREYLILQDGDHIYMNISLYSRRNLKFVFFSIPQYFKSRTILQSFRRTVLRGTKSAQRQAQAII
jgi:hypothetical protein